jgi:hypothetical protein
VDVLVGLVLRDLPFSRTSSGSSSSVLLEGQDARFHLLQAGFQGGCAKEGSCQGGFRRTYIPSLRLGASLIADRDFGLSLASNSTPGMLMKETLGERTTIIPSLGRGATSRSMVGLG